MNYELAKKLKDAGFPQGASKMAHFPELCGLETKQSWHGDKPYRFHDWDESLKCCEFISTPTLSELISACGDEFDTLHHNGVIWQAGIGDGEDGGSFVADYVPMGESSTPEEAVANLWLALNEKKQHHV